MKKNESPWASGSAEILRHAIGLLEKDTDTNRRLAMILVDNAVEQMIKTYFSLPYRITGLKIARKLLEEIFGSFPALLDALEEHAREKLDGVDLGAIEWYHRLRNELYHQGIGLTVEREKVEIYAELANILFKNLFGSTLIPQIGVKTDVLGFYLELWSHLETGLADTAAITAKQKGMHRTRFPDSAQFLLEEKVMSKTVYNEIQNLRKIRNGIVHNQLDYRETLSPEIMRKLSELVNQYFDFKAYVNK